MNTDQIQERIISLLQGDLVDPGELSALIDALSAHPEEQALLLDQIRMHREFESLTRSTRLPAEQKEEIVQKAGSGPGDSSGWNLPVRSLMLLALCLLFFFGGMSLGDDDGDLLGTAASAGQVDYGDRIAHDKRGAAAELPADRLIADRSRESAGSIVNGVAGTTDRVPGMETSRENRRSHVRENRSDNKIRRSGTTSSSRLTSVSNNSTTRISGIVNDYASVVSMPDRRHLIVDATVSFAPGDLVLIVQMQGTAVDEDVRDFGRIRSAGDAGAYEFARVASSENQRVRLQQPASKVYSPESGLQIVRVPEYENVIVEGRVTAGPWDGKKGGVVAIVASGTVKLDAEIDVRGAGFRGGVVGHQVTVVPEYVADLVGPVDPERYGRKGEGIAGLGEGDNAAGRAPFANGGGGGGNHNAGGGGGAGGGCGGPGGYSYRNWRYTIGDYRQTGGFGGEAVESSRLRIVAGGGGGAGHSNVSPLIKTSSGTGGASGGGIVLVVARTIEANRGEIIADGEDALDAGADGAGGGGGAGTVVVTSERLIGSLRISASGGRGGNTLDTLEAAEIGTGGGGGGGTVVLDDRLTSSDIVIALEGGEAGRTTRGNLYGAGRGCRGVVRYVSVPDIDAPAPSGTLQNLR